MCGSKKQQQIIKQISNNNNNDKNGKGRTRDNLLTRFGPTMTYYGEESNSPFN
jgi:hypothetical protein